MPFEDADSFLPKILGCYEQELHTAVEAAIHNQPDVILNIGCAEGYYAVGLAMRLPKARCIAFDCVAEEQQRCLETASGNGVAARLEARGLATNDALNEFLDTADRPLVLCDCEGCEADLLDPALSRGMGRADIIVELHDRPGTSSIRAALESRFASSHSITIVRSGARNPAEFEFLRPLNQFLQLLAVCEFRDWSMEWLVMSPRRTPLT